MSHLLSEPITHCSDGFRFDVVIAFHLLGDLIGTPDAVDDMDQGITHVVRGEERSAVLDICAWLDVSPVRVLP